MQVLKRGEVVLKGLHEGGEARRVRFHEEHL
jgi:hypothetical protein